MKQPIFKAGSRGRQVRVAKGRNHGAPCYWCYYRTPAGQRTGKPFPFTTAGRADAVGYAQGILDQQTTPAPAARPRLTVAQVWGAFVSERGRGWRYNTRRIYHEAWTPFESVAGAHTTAEDVGRASMSATVTAMEDRNLAVSTIQKTMSVVRQVYAFGVEAELIEKNKVGTYRYRVAKERRTEAPAEYGMADFGKLLDALPIHRRGTWRAHVALGVCGYQGVRQHSVLHLQWSDVEWEADRIWWRARWDKGGNLWDQPLREPTRVLLEVARRWHAELGLDSPWVFPAPRNPAKVYTIQTLWWNLRQAEARAGIAHVTRRAGHGLRRLLAGEVNEATGDAMLAMLSIGDRDMKQALRYLKKRDRRVRSAFDTLDAQLSSNRQVETGDSAAEAVGACAEAESSASTQLPRRDSNPRPAVYDDATTGHADGKTPDVSQSAHPADRPAAPKTPRECEATVRRRRLR